MFAWLLRKRAAGRRAHRERSLARWLARTDLATHQGEIGAKVAELLWGLDGKPVDKVRKEEAWKLFQEELERRCAMDNRKLFTRAVEFVLAHEGDAYTDHPLDRGGPTRYGIARRWHPDVNVRELTREQAIEIYRERYWKGQRYETLPEPIAIKVFDLAVNLGKRVAVSCLQRALRACGVPVKVDGLLGKETALASWRAGDVALMAALRSEAAGEYRIRLERDGSQAMFGEGWMRRAYA